MHSSASAGDLNVFREAMSNDIVLEVSNIKEWVYKTGRQVTLLEIDNAQHDIFLSGKTV
jgi:hypothetical protein